MATKMEQVQDFLARAMNLTNTINTQNREDRLKAAQKLISEATALRVRGTSPILKRVTNEINSALSAVQAIRPGQYIALKFNELKDAQNDLARLATSEGEGYDEVVHDGHTPSRPRDPENYLTEFDTEIFKHGRETPKVTIGNRPFAVHRVPVIAISKPMINTDALTKAGVKAQTVNQYSVIHGQLVIGISHKTSFKEKEGRSTKTTAQKAAEVAAMIGKTTKRPVKPVSEQGYAYGGATWFWYAEDRTMNALYKSARGSLKVEKWGFAFN